MQGTLSELLEIALNAKQLHWVVEGPNFVGVHKLLDELVESAHEYADEIAERMVYLSGDLPDGRPQIFIEDAHFTLDKRTYYSPEVCEWVVERLDECSSNLDAAIVELEDDLATQDILIRTQQAMDKYQWMFRAHV